MMAQRDMKDKQSYKEGNIWITVTFVTDGDITDLVWFLYLISGKVPSKQTARMCCN